MRIPQGVFRQLLLYCHAALPLSSPTLGQRLCLSVRRVGECADLSFGPPSVLEVVEPGRPRVGYVYYGTGT